MRAAGEPAPGGRTRGPGGEERWLSRPSQSISLGRLPRGGEGHQRCRERGWEGGSGVGSPPSDTLPPLRAQDPTCGRRRRTRPADVAGRDSWERTGPPGPSRSTVLAVSPPDPEMADCPGRPAALLPPPKVPPTSALVGPGLSEEALYTYLSPDRSCRPARFRNGAPAQAPCAGLGQRRGFHPGLGPAVLSIGLSFLEAPEETGRAGSEGRAVAQRKGQCCHLAASPRTSELGAATRSGKVGVGRGETAWIQPKKSSGFLPHPPQGKINSLWHFPAFLIFNQTIVGGWPPWAGMEDFPSGGANLPTPRPAASGRRAQPALPGTMPLCSPPSGA